MSTSETGKKQISSYNGSIRIEEANSRGIVSDSTNNRLLFGLDDDDNIKIKLSQSGYDVITATDDQLIWSSDFNSFKIVSVGSGSISGIDNSASALWAVNTTTIAHNLGYVPGIISYVTGSNTYFPTRERTMPAPVNFSSALAFPWAEYIDAHVDETNVYIRYNVCGSNNASGRSASYKYYLLRETAT